jgi:hypothetical protein
MVNKLMIDSGFYILIGFDFDADTKIFNMALGQQYQEDGLKSIQIKDDGKFIRYFENGTQKTIRDLDTTTKTFEEIAGAYVELLLHRFPKSAIITQVDGEYVNYFDEE